MLFPEKVHAFARVPTSVDVYRGAVKSISPAFRDEPVSHFLTTRRLRASWKAKWGNMASCGVPDATALELRLKRSCLASPRVTPPPYGIFTQRLGKRKHSEATHYAALIMCATTFKTGDSRCLNVISMPSGISLKVNNSLLVHVGRPSK